MPKVSLIIDGQKVEVSRGTTILEAARQHGVEIPTLCHDPRLHPTAACRLCLVEVEGARGPMPACTAPVTEGMMVRTRTDELTSLRRMTLELLLSDHYGDCIAPCKLTCPAGIDVQGSHDLIAAGQHREALKLIKEKNPLPLVCGRVCPRFCEVECRRNLIDEPVAINYLKRFVADHDIESGQPYVPKPKPASGHKVAIVGGGPAGLSAAYYLALEGHEVTIFDASPQLGGMLRYGIPEYRLPKEVLDKEIALITGLCHEVRSGTVWGKDFTLSSLQAEGYQAFFIALGAWANQKMGITGEDLPGVLSGIGFLRDVTLGKPITLGDKVAIIGGGNTAIDAARTALRLGAGEVTIIYRRSREEMPANDEEIEETEEEGIQIQFLSAPIAINSRNGRVESVHCIRMALGEPDSSGRRRPEPIPGSEFTMPVDNVIAAIGQTLNTADFDRESKLELSQRGYIVTNAETMETSLPGVFAGGDCTSGPATAVEAIGAAKRAADSINQYLSCGQVILGRKPYNCKEGKLSEIDASQYQDAERIPRIQMPVKTPEERKSNFDQIALGFTEPMALKEASRCLDCGCLDVFECQLRKLATEYQVDDTRFDGRKHHLPIRENEHPYILRDQNKCILCGRCVRICDEVMGINAYGFIERGFETLIEPTLGMPLCETDCISCGQCVNTCPTGAITPKVTLPKSGPWELERTLTVCPYCGIGCNLEINTVGDAIVSVTSPLDSTINKGNLCVKGSFYPGALNHEARLTVPLVKKDGKLTATSWEEAISRAGEGIRQIKDKSGAESLALLSSPKLTNEENYLAQKLARTALETNNIGSLGVPLTSEELARSLGKNASSGSYGDILKSDLVLTFDCDLLQDYPILALKVRKALADGSKLITFNSRPTRNDPLAQITLRINPVTSAGLLRAMLNYIISHDLVDAEFVRERTTGFEKLKQEMKEYPLEQTANRLWIKPARVIEAINLYLKARRPVIILNADTVSPTELILLSNLALVTGKIGREGAGLIALHAAGNAQGLIDMGVNPNYLPGHQPVRDPETRRRFETAWGKPIPAEPGKDATAIMSGIAEGNISGIIVLGSDATGETGNAIFEKPAFSVLVDSVPPAGPPYPDVVLPGANFTESTGSYTNCERRWQHLHRVFPPPGGKENWEIIAALSTALGYPMVYKKATSIAKEITGLTADLKMGKSDKHPENGKKWPFLSNGKFNFADGLARLRPTDAGSGEATETLAGLPAESKQ
jgi:formate dehydrogenase major subunit